MVYYPEVHGPEGLGPIITPSIDYPIHPLHRVKEICEKFIDELAIINVGRLSSLATSFILGIKVMRNAKEYVLMGGAFFFLESDSGC
ncbi:hypothetical protein GCM10007199_39860 [Fictibacillus barbaricus]|nr:hypothetical protein GCM10007199_39860 [Fictibacillus barbaricus]